MVGLDNRLYMNSGQHTIFLLPLLIAKWSHILAVLKSVKEWGKENVCGICRYFGHVHSSLTACWRSYTCRLRFQHFWEYEVWHLHSGFQVKWRKDWWHEDIRLFYMYFKHNLSSYLRITILSLVFILTVTWYKTVLVLMPNLFIC